MLHEAQRTSAPSAVSVSISTAVWIVMCSEPAMRAPRSGCLPAYSARIAINAGISDSAIRISLRPQSASERSATRKSVNFESAAFMHGLQKDKAPAPFPMRAPLNLAEPGPPSDVGTQRSSAGRIVTGSSSFSRRVRPCILAPVSASLVASVVFLKIAEFARRSASEQARLRAQLEAVVAVVTAEIDPANRVVLEAADGAAIVLIDDPRAALGREAALVRAGNFTDAGLRAHEVFSPSDSALGRRRRRYSAASLVLVVALVAAGFAWRATHEPRAPFLSTIIAKYPYFGELVQRVRY